MKFQKESDVVFLQFLSRNFMNYYQPLPKTHIEHGTFKMLYSVVGAFLNPEKIKFSLYSFHVIHDYLTIRRQTRGFYLLIVDKGRRPKSTIKVNKREREKCEGPASDDLVVLYPIWSQTTETSVGLNKNQAPLCESFRSSVSCRFSFIIEVYSMSCSCTSWNYLVLINH